MAGYSMRLGDIQVKRPAGKTRGSSAQDSRQPSREQQSKREPVEYSIPEEIDVPGDETLRYTFLALCAAATVKVQDGKAPWCKTYEIARAMGQEHSNFAELETLREQGFIVKSTRFFPSSFAPKAFLPARDGTVVGRHSQKDARTSAIMRQLQSRVGSEQDEQEEKVG